MRKINTQHFRRATRDMPREVNRQIVLNLLRELQPISRAELARRMGVGRALMTLIVKDLIAEGLVYEGEVGESKRGRKPRLLHVRTRDRYIVAIDVRYSRTHLALSDYSGRLSALEEFDTRFAPEELVAELADRVRELLRRNGVADCEAIGVVVPGRVDRRTGVVLNALQLGWRNVDLRRMLGAATGMPVYVENAPVACAMAEAWLSPRESHGMDNFVYVSVSDGVGTGVVANGEVVRGHVGTAGEFGHIPLTMDGPRCLCGSRGCWEAYTSNLVTLARYLGLDLAHAETRALLRESGLFIPDLIARARVGDEAALRSLQETGFYLGVGLAGIINALNPARIIVGGEITGAWELMESTVRDAIHERALMPGAVATHIIPDLPDTHPRLRGAAALVIAPSFAAPRVA